MVTLTSTPTPEAVAAALRGLAVTMDDPYLMDDAALARALAAGVAHAVLAEADGTPAGVALYSLFVSTTRGQIGAFVTDLWLDERLRGAGLGRALLARVRDDVAARWGATFLRLNYYGGNAGAAGFYTKLGFRPRPDEIWVTLEGQDLEDLG